MLIGSHKRLSSIEKPPSIKNSDQFVKRVTHTKTVGVTVNEFHTWDEHIEILTKNCRQV